MVFTFAACGNTQNESDRTTSGSTAESQNTRTPQEPEAVVNEDGFTESRNKVQDAEPDIIAWLEKLGYAK